MRPIFFRKDRERLMEIKEEQLGYESRQQRYLLSMDNTLTEILKVLKRRKDGKRKISRKN